MKIIFTYIYRWRYIIVAIWLAISLFKIATFHAIQSNHSKSIYPVFWPSLAEIDYQKHIIPARIKKLDGNYISLAGFLVPLDDNALESKEFLLVPNSQGCIHVPPPPPNQVVHVKMEKQIPINWKPLWIEGKLRMENDPQKPFALYMDGVASKEYNGHAVQVED